MNERKTPRPATPPGASAAPSRLEAKQIAASSRHRMSEPRRRLATASMVMAGAQIAAVPILVILGLAMFYANY